MIEWLVEHLALRYEVHDTRRARPSARRRCPVSAATLSGIFAVKFPVRDLASRREWYERVFDLELLFEFPDEDGTVRDAAYRVPGLGDTGIALRERPDVAGLSGFDPVVFAVADKAAVDAWSTKLDALSISPPGRARHNRLGRRAP